MASRNNNTELSSLLSTTHGRERRQARSIQKIDLQRARRYGMEEPSHRGRLKLTYGGIVFIYDKRRNMEITSFPSKDYSSDESGTKVVPPILLQKNTAYMSAKYLQIHKCNKRQIMADHASWTSHSVFVVDMSGSMRCDDVSGGKCRSDTVWMVLAKDFVRSQLEAKTVTGWDVVSIILMRADAEVVIEYEPLDWILYNELIDRREWTTSRPFGPGNYLPALDKAEELLASNSLGTCALSLVFFSDGKPSDHGPFVAKMGEIASQYRRRLTLHCIGIAQAAENESFETLHDMVAEAEAFGAKSTFTAPSLDSTSLSNIVSSVASSLTSTKSEMTDLATGETRAVRQDVRSERHGTADDLHPTDEWQLYGVMSSKSVGLSTKSVGRIWSWLNDEFVLLRDPRCIHCKEDGESMWCPGCNAVAICGRCADTEVHHEVKCRFLKDDYQSGRIMTKDLPSFSVAIKKPIFGEGAERIVRKFRFIDHESNFIGPKMVAKESRFVNPSSLKAYNDKRAFHAAFMRTQVLASDIASHFNKAMDDLKSHFVKELNRAWISRLPRIEFIEPLVVEVRDGPVEKRSMLIEQFLVGEYIKFNNNMGFVKGMREDKESASNNEEKPALVMGNVDLGAIQEGSDEEEDSDDELYDPKTSKPDHIQYGDIEDHLFPQAFSHYSFEKTKRSLMVIDLQGVFHIDHNGNRKFMLTDPAIHRKSSRSTRRDRDFGRTDRGKKGMKAFFETHSCSDACRLLGLRKVDAQTLEFQ